MSRSLIKSNRVVLILAMLACSIFLLPQPTAALCSQPQEEGNWVNVDSNTRSLPRIQLRFVCKDQIVVRRESRGCNCSAWFATTEPAVPSAVR